MKNAGIICEYNPFHNAHAYHIRETKKILGDASGVVCVMSGNFVQRGEPAVFSKHVRAEAAVRSGADLVIELPLPWAVSSAEKFAFGGVSLLNGLGVVTHLSFGSESGSVEELASIADALLAPEMDEWIKYELKSGIAYAAARQKAIGRFMPKRARLLKEPNNILSIEYLKALKTLRSPLEPITTKRYAAAHDSTEIFEGFASASKIREMISTGEDVRKFVPEPLHEMFLQETKSGRAPIFMQNMELPVLSRLRIMQKDAFEQLPDNAEGLSMRLMRYARSEPTVQEILEKTKTKRYALSRIRRMVLSAYLGLTAADAEGTPPYIRVLAFNGKGQKILREIADKAAVPVLTKPADVKKLDGRAQRLFEKEAAATDLYRLACPNPSERGGGKEWTISPKRVETHRKD